MNKYVACWICLVLAKKGLNIQSLSSDCGALTNTIRYDSDLESRDSLMSNVTQVFNRFFFLSRTAVWDLLGSSRPPNLQQSRDPDVIRILGATETAREITSHGVRDYYITEHQH